MASEERELIEALHRKVDAQIARDQERHEAISDLLHRHDRSLYGNGQPGVIAKVDTLAATVQVQATKTAALARSLARAAAVAGGVATLVGGGLVTMIVAML